MDRDKSAWEGLIGFTKGVLEVDSNVDLLSVVGDPLSGQQLAEEQRARHCKYAYRLVKGWSASGLSDVPIEPGTIVVVSDGQVGRSSYWCQPIPDNRMVCEIRDGNLTVFFQGKQICSRLVARDAMKLLSEITGEYDDLEKHHIETETRYEHEEITEGDWQNPGVYRVTEHESEREVYEQAELFLIKKGKEKILLDILQVLDKAVGP